MNHETGQLTGATDQQLICAYVEQGSQAAFRDLVNRHVGWLFAAAHRQLGDRHLAEDATQTVFILLARNSHAMRSHPKISGWLFTTLQFAVKNIRTAERRREVRERRAARERPAVSPVVSVQRDDLPLHLDAAVARLPRAERDAVLLRFYRDFSFEEIAETLGTTEAAARKRVSRAVEGLRRRLGASATPASLSAAAALPLAHASPGLADAVAKVALAAKAGAPLPSGLVATTKGTIHLMTLSKLKTVAVVVAVALVAPATLVAVQKTLPTTDQAGDSRVTLRLTSSGAAARHRRYIRQQLELSPVRPAGIDKLPPDLVGPEYGVIKIDGRPGATYHVVIDQRPAKPSRLFVDANGNGDLTDDPPAAWAAYPTPWVENGKISRTGPRGEICQTYRGGADVELGTADAPFTVRLLAYRFDRIDPEQGALHGKLFYYADYAREGDAVLGGKSYHVMLIDPCATGDFRSGRNPLNGADVKLFVDRNGNGRPDGVIAELYEADAPFNVGGTTYELRDIPKDGSSFRLVRSEKTVAERPPFIDLAEGKPAPKFRVKALDGTEVNFPDDYRGKVVLLDFWATECAPCMAEMPKVVDTYQKLHDKGFEVLGVTLDDAGSPEPVRKAMKDHGMAWPEVFDGPGTRGPLARLYGVEAIPAPFLVDGDTGKLIATGGELRGGRLREKVEAALAKRENRRGQKGPVENQQ